MSKYNVEQKPACWKRTKYNICIKFAIAIIVCALLCCACYFVEKGRSRRNLHKLQNSEKLIQIEKTPYKVKSSLNARNIGARQSTSSNVEGSGDYGDVTEIKAGPIQASDTKEVESISLFDNIQSSEVTAGNAQFANHIEKIYAPVPLLQDDTIDEPVSTEIIENTTFMTQRHYGYDDIGIEEALAQAADAAEVENTKRNIFLSLQKASHATDRSSNERFFSNEYTFDLSSSTYDDLSDEYILTNYDNGDYIKVKEASNEAEVQDSVDVSDMEQILPGAGNMPNLFDSILGSVTNLLNPITPQGRAPKPYLSSNHHLSNFKDSPYNSDHLEQETYVKPIVRESNEPKVKPSRHHGKQSWVSSHKTRPSLISRLLNGRQDPVKDSLKMLKDFLN